MRCLRLWFLVLLCLSVPSLSWGQGQLVNGNRTQAGANNYAQTTGTGTAYVLTLNPALPGYVDGTCFLVRVHVANTGDATLNVNGKGAIPLRKWSGGSAVPLVAGDLSVQQDVIACYDSTNGPRMQVLSLGGGSGIGITDTDKGDISVSGGGTVWTIDTSAVTYAKLQNTSAPSVLLGRGSGSAGPPQEITLGSGLNMSGTTLSVSAGGGNVSNSGTPVDNQVAVWTTASQIEGVPAFIYNAGTLGVGTAGTTGKVALSGSVSGAVTLQPQNAGGTYNFNLPTTAGTAGQALLSGGGGTSPMTWSTVTPTTIAAADSGVVCNGTDTTAAMQTVLNLRQPAPRTTTGFIISMPRGGQCLLTSTLLIDSVYDLALQGNDVEFLWGGPPGVPMFLCRDCNLTRWENFRVRTTAAAPVSAVFQFENGSNTSVTPTRNVVQFVTIECTNGGCTNGIVMAQGAGGDANDDFNFFSHLMIQNYTGSCFRIEHSQSKTNFLSHVGCSGNGIGQHFLRVEPRGSFICEVCNGGGHLAADFYVAAGTDFGVIRDSNFEDSAAFLDTGGPSGGAFPFNVENVRWNNANLRTDNRVISFQYRGPLRLKGFAVEQGPTPKATEIFFNPGGGIGTLVAEGNAIASTLANPFTNKLPTTQVSNLRYDGSAWIALQDRTTAVPPAAQTVSNGSVLTANACGGTKLLAATGAATTDTTNTFDTPGSGNVGCRMDVCNTSAFALTLDANANFRTIDGNNVVLGAATASAMQCTGVTQTGTQWVQLTGVGTTGGGGFVDVAGSPTADQVALYVDANTIYGSSTLAMNVTDLDVSTATRTRPNKVGTGTPPAGCAVGDTFFKSDATAGQNVYGCTAPGVWTLEGGTGGGNVSAVGPPSSGQAAEWTGATTIQGVATTGTGFYVKATSPSINTPAISSFTNATHNHTNAAGGGQISDTALSGPVSVAKGGTGAATLAAAGIAVVGSSNSWAAGVKQTFAPNATNAGLNPGSVAGDPSTPANGDLWYDSTNNLLRARINSASVSLGAGGGTPGGTSGQVQYNNASAFGGSTAFTLNSTQVLTTTRRVTALSASTTLTNAHGPVIRCTAPSADTILTLPAVASTPSSHYELVKTDATAFACQFKAATGESLNNTLNGSASATTQNATVVVDVIDTTAWSAVSGKTSVGLSDLTPASAQSLLLARGQGAGGGSWQEVTLGAGLTMTGTQLAASTTVVRTDQANTWSTGAQDMGAATSFKVPTSAGAAPTANGLLAYDSTSNTLEYGENGTNRTIAKIIASGTAALGTSAIASGACATTVTVSATGVATTDVIAWTPNADISAVTGYAPVTTGALIIYPFPTANNISFKVCNPTSSSITPGAVTLNFRVAR